MTYEIQIRHRQLNKFQVVRGSTPTEARQKADAKLAEWDQRYAQLVERENKRIAAENKKAAVESRRSEMAARTAIAEERTREAQETIGNLSGIFEVLLSPNRAIDLNSFKKIYDFNEPMPTEFNLAIHPSAPSKADSKYVPKLRMLDKLFGSRRSKKQAAYDYLFEQDYLTWQNRCLSIDMNNSQLAEIYSNNIKTWEDKRQASVALNSSYLEEFVLFATNLQRGQEDEVLQYFSKVLDEIPLPEPLECE